jgi:uncharacterized membrane protein YidH (DUF202 family)
MAGTYLGASVFFVAIGVVCIIKGLLNGANNEKIERREPAIKNVQKNMNGKYERPMSIKVTDTDFDDYFNAWVKTWFYIGVICIIIGIACLFS